MYQYTKTEKAQVKRLYIKVKKHILKLEYDLKRLKKTKSEIEKSRFI